LPKTTPLQLDTWSLEAPHAQITLVVSSTQAAARCPTCETPTRHVHRRYTRTLADLPWSGYQVTWRRRVRKFFCREATCARRSFTARLPGVASPWARRTLRRTAGLLAIGLALGGAAGVRLRQSLGLLVRRTTLVRVIRRAPCPVMVPPQVLSVDDIALRRRHTDGTLLLDLARRQPLALLPDRAASPGAQWLQAHPGGEVLVRDRAEASAEAARLGAPRARQVADRFHLLHHLADVLTDVFRAHAPQLALSNAQPSPAPTPVHAPEDCASVPHLSAVPLAPPQPSTRAAALAAARRAQRVAPYEPGWTYHRPGWTLDTLAHQVGLSRRIVQRSLQSPTFPERQPRHSRDHSLLDPYKAALLAGWNRGCRHAAPLFRTIRRQGFRGQYGIVAL
jgi:transposase